MWDIEAAGSDVCRHEHTGFALGELIQMLEALALLQSCVQRACRYIEQLKDI
jgi:hypothetical protein